MTVLERYIAKYTFSTDVNVKLKRLQKFLLKNPLRLQQTKLEIISLKYDGYITNTVGIFNDISSILKHNDFKT